MLLLPMEERTIAFHEFTRQQESVDGRDTVADEAGHPLAFGALALLYKHRPPQGGELLIVLLQAGGKFFLALPYLFQCAVILGGCSDG